MTFRNTRFNKRDYDCTNLVACVADVSPGEGWEPCDDAVLANLTRLWSQGRTTYYGYM